MIRLCQLLIVLAALLPVAALPAHAGEDRFETRTLKSEAPVLCTFVQDLNLDGRPDFAFFAEDRRFVLFFQLEDGTFRRGEAKYVMPAGTDSLDLADMGGDGVPDICLTVAGRELQVIDSSGRASFWEDLAAAGRIDPKSARVIGLQAGDGPSPGPLTDSLHRSPDLVWDLDGDGRQDLLYPRFGGLDVWLNPGGEAGMVRHVIPRGPLVSLGGSRIEVRREMPRILDLYGRGGAEVVYDPQPTHGLGQLDGGWSRYIDGDIGFSHVVQELQFAIGESVTGYRFDDFNGDGEPDLAVLSSGFNFDEPGGQGTVASGGGSFFDEKTLRLWLSAGPGEKMSRLPAGEWTSEINLWQEAVIRYRDLTGDGEGDICLYYYKGLINAKLMVDIYPGLGKGRFGQRVKGQKIGFDDARRQTILSDSDMDGDGLPDLVLAADGKVRVLRRAADGRKPYDERPWAVLGLRPEADEGEGETVTISIGSSGSSVDFQANRLEGIRVLEVNGDGAPDVVVLNRPREWDEKNEGRPPVTLLLHLSLNR